MNVLSIIEKVLEFTKSIPTRTTDHLNTTIGGGVVGVGFAALIGQIETATGCHFATAFANIDWLQITGYVFSQVFGALSTDANKTVTPIVTTMK